MRKPVLTISAAGTASLLGVWTVPVTAQVYDWTGPYVGVSLGAMQANGDVALEYPDGVSAPDTLYFDAGNVPHFSTAPLAVGAIAFPSIAQLLSGKGGGTVNVGYDQQVGTLVYGAEVDAAFFTGGQSSWSTGTVFDAVNNRTHSLSVTSRIDQFYSFRPRMGVAIDRLMLFGTAGLSLGRVDLESAASFSYTDLGYAGGTGNADWSGRMSNWQLGFIAGIGAEYALTDNVSFKVEGLYYNLGSAKVTAQGSGTYNSTPLTVAPYEASIDLSGAIVKGGINFRF